MTIFDLDLPIDVQASSLGDPQQLAQSLADTVVDALRSAIDSHGHATLVVSGGRSPVRFFQCLAQVDLPWQQVTISLADERWVPAAHPDSNEGLVRRHLLQGPASKARLLGLYQPTETLEAAALAADQALAELPPIDVLVLGMGEDGHTASLFPASPNLSLALQVDSQRRCLPMHAPSAPHQRLSMTLALLSRARLPLLALQGAAKLETLAEALRGDDVATMPIRAFLRAPLAIYWCP